MVPGVSEVAAAGWMGGNSHHLPSRAVQGLALAIAKRMRYKTGEARITSTSEKCKKSEINIHSIFKLLQKIKFIIKSKALICTLIPKW